MVQQELWEKGEVLGEQIHANPSLWREVLDWVLAVRGPQPYSSRYSWTTRKWWGLIFEILTRWY